MANELAVTATISFLKGNMSSAAARAVTGKTVTVSGTNFIQNTQQVGTAEEALQLGDVATPGYMWCKNVGTTVIHIRAATAAANTIKLSANEIALFRHSGAAPFVIAITNPGVLEYLLIED